MPCFATVCKVCNFLRDCHISNKNDKTGQSVANRGVNSSKIVVKVWGVTTVGSVVMFIIHQIAVRNCNTSQIQLDPGITNNLLALPLLERTLRLKQK